VCRGSRGFVASADQDGLAAPTARR
jgi:hypothetical protein